MPTTVTISEFQIPDCNFAGTTAKLRRYYDSDWLDVDNVWHAGGVVGSSTGFFDEINCTLAGNTITVPSFPATPTDNALVGTPRETWQLWDQSGVARNIIFEGFIPSSPSTTTHGALLIANQGQTLSNPPNVYLNSAGVQALINVALGIARFATSVIAGWVRLSVAAVSVNDPIAVGDNDRRNQESYNVKATVIGAKGDGTTNDRTALNTLVNTTLSTGGDVYFPAGDYVIGSNMTFPASVRLVFAKNARLKPSNGVTVTIQGEIAPTLSQIFTNALAAQGTISFSGDKSIKEFLGEWWGAISDDSTDSSSALAAAAVARNQVGGTLMLLPSSSGYLVGGAAVANQILSMTSPGAIIGQGPRSVLLVHNSTPATTDVIRITPPVGTAEFGYQFPEGNAGYTLKNFSIMPQSGTSNPGIVTPPKPGRDAIRVDTTAVGSYFEKGNFEGLYLGDLGGHSISFLNKSGACVNTDGIYSNRVYNNWLYGGIYAECFGDSNQILYNRFRGLGKAVEIESFVTGAGNLQLIGNNLTADGGISISGGTGHRIEGNFNELYKAGAAGTDGATFSLKGSASMVVIKGNLFGALNGNLLDGIRVGADVSIASIDDNYFNIPATKFAINAQNSGANASVFLGAAGILVGGGGYLTNASSIAQSVVFSTSNGSSTRVGSPLASGTTEIVGGFGASDPAVLELNRSVATSTETKYAALSGVTNQSGTANSVLVIYGSNTAIGTSDKRLGLIQFATDGAINSGAVNFYTMNAGTLNLVWGVNHLGLFTVQKTLRIVPVAFASLPSSPTEGMMVPVTDSNSATFNAVMAGGGANHVIAFYDGTNWRVH